MIDKDLALQVFLQDFLEEPLFFDFLRELDGSYSIIPVQAPRAVKTYIDGTAIRQYDFALQVLFIVSDTTDTVNTDNIFRLRIWQEWIEQQEKEHNYPDFGIKCSDYVWSNLSNMPTRAQLYDNGMGKYQFFARLQYREVP